MDWIEELLTLLRSGEFAPPAPQPGPRLPLVEVVFCCPNCEGELVEGARCCSTCGQALCWPSVALVEGGRN